MKIIRLSAENVKRLTAVEVTPEGTLITIGGKNGAGKSSVLDSIAYALGGEKLVPSEPIRTGETEAKIVVDLGDLVVTRTFKRERGIDEHSGAALRSSEGVVVMSPTNSYLTVTNKEGAKYPSPQAMLDKLLGKLTFDPLQFARANAKEQNETLRRLVGLDTRPWDDVRKAAYDRRTVYKKQLAEAEAKLKLLPFHSSAGVVEVSMEEVSQEMLKASQRQEDAVMAGRVWRSSEEAQLRVETEVQKRYAVIEELQKRIAVETAEVGKLEVKYLALKAQTEKLKEAAEFAMSTVPDVEVIRKKLSDVEALNAKVRENARHLEAKAERDRLVQAVKEETHGVEAAEEAKREALAKVKYPVVGLGLSEDGVTFNGIPFEQASNAEQIRVSVAIGLALNPTLKVLLVRNGNGLDQTSLKAITEQASAADAQLWMEWVAETKDGVTVMLEDGAVV